MQYVALIAHDAKKEALLNLVRHRRGLMAEQSVIATESTGTLIERETGLPVKKVLSGPMGGDLQIGALIALGEVKAVIFLRDPLCAHAHEPDISALMKVCDIHSVPLATNLATAELVLTYIAMHPEPPG